MCPRDGFVVIRVRAITLSVIAVQLVILKVGITFPYEGQLVLEPITPPVLLSWAVKKIVL